MDNTRTIVVIIASLILGTLSNWLYDLFKAKGIFPDKPKLKHIIVIFTIFTPIIYLVALPQLSTSDNNNRANILRKMPLEVVPTPKDYRVSPSDPVRIYIPSLSIDRTIFPVGLDSNKFAVSPKREIGWFIYSARPGEGSNIVLWGRRFPIKDPGTPTYSAVAVLGNLEDINIYDRVSLVTREGRTYVYRVVSKLAVTEDKVEYLFPTDKEQLTLIGAVGDTIPAGGSFFDKDKKLVIIAEPVLQ